MTPAIKLLTRKKLPHRVHQYQHQPGAASYGLEAADKLGLAPEQVFKTLVIRLDGQSLAIAILPVHRQLSLKKAAAALAAKKAAMADPEDVRRSTGYVLGGVSPLGQKKSLPTLIDTSALAQSAIFVSAGKRGLEIEQAPDTLGELLRADFVALCQ